MINQGLIDLLGSINRLLETFFGVVYAVHALIVWQVFKYHGFGVVKVVDEMVEVRPELLGV